MQTALWITAAKTVENYAFVDNFKNLWIKCG